MDTRTQTAAVWSFVLPAVAMVATWMAFRLSYQGYSAGQLAGLALLDAGAAAGGLILVSRCHPCRGWAVAGAVSSVLAVVTAILIALLAALAQALSGLTF